MNPDGSRKAGREGFLLSTLRRRQRKALRAFLCLTVFCATLLASFAGNASIYIDKPAVLRTGNGTIAENAKIVSLLFGITLLRYDGSAVPNTVVSPVTLNGGSATLPGPTDGNGMPLMGSVANPVQTTLPLVPVTASPVYADGEAVFFSLEYPSHANDPLAIDTARIRVRIYNGTTLIDEEILEVHETTTTSGVFTGYFQNTASAGGPGDGLLRIPPGARVEMVDVDDINDFNPTQDSLATAAFGNAGPGNQALFVSKRAQRETVAIGDFLQYQIDIEDTATNAATGTVLTDVLPRGFRYRAGSATLDGVKTTDPVISSDGSIMSFTLGDIAPTQRIELRYVVEVTSGARTGKAGNRAAAASNNGAGSNTAVAVVKVTEDLFRSSAIVVGRVGSSCAANAQDEKHGIAGVRLYMEDGSTVVTDARGRYHLSGLKPGTHVVQLDAGSLPDGMEAVTCEENTRHARNPLSQFVEVQGGGLARADFHLRRTTTAPAVEESTPDAAVDSSLGVQLTSSTENGIIHYRAEITAGPAPIASGAGLLLKLPPQLKLLRRTLQRDGTEIDAEHGDDGSELITLGALDAAAHAVVEFDALTRDEEVTGEVETQAWAVVDRAAGRISSPPAGNTANIHAGQAGDEFNITLSTNFAPMTATLNAFDKLKLLDVVEKLRTLNNPRIVVSGHTDNTPVPKGSAKKPPAFADNYALSQARAQAVADFLAEQLGLATDAFVVKGLGPDQPLADNKTAKGRAGNRRVELSARSRDEDGSAIIEITRADSGETSLQVPAPDAAVAEEKPASADTGDAGEAEEAVAAEPEAKPGILNFADGQNVSERIQQFRVLMDSRLTPQLSIDDTVISNERIGYRGVDHRSGMTLYSYIGVDLGERGEHVVRIAGNDPFGNPRFEQNLHLLRTGDIRSVRLLETPEGAYENVADGKTPVRLRVEVLDDQQRPIAGGSSLIVSGGDLVPEHAENAADPLQRTGNRVQVASDGTISFRPVTQAGRYRLRLSWGESQYEDFTVFVKPHFRDWILVGIGEGSVLARTISGHTQGLGSDERDEGLDSDGRVAFFAKGKVRGDWLLTAAYDTDKPHTDSLNTGSIDPNGWYTLYGDASSQDRDAPSQGKLYLKIERENYYALFGDYDTGLDVTELSRYERRLNGIKTEYWGSRIDALLFTSSTRQAYMHDALRGDGTSGLYHLSRRGAIPGSEQIAIETRDRFRSEIVIKTRMLSRFLDYNVDYDSGTLWFKEPVAAQDDEFNPVYIVAEYEVDSGIDDSTDGVRLEARPRAGLTVGVTGVREGLGNGDATLAGVDVKAVLNERNTVTLEAAGTDSSVPASSLPATGGTTGSGDAFLLKHEYNSKKLVAESYIREYGEGFGIGQNSATESATRKIGSDLRYSVDDNLKLDGRLLHQEQLDTGLGRDVVEGRATLERDKRALFGGVRLAEEDAIAGDSRSSQQLIGGVRQRLLDNRLELKLQGETNVSESTPNSLDYPHRLLAGASYRLDQKTSLIGQQEWDWGNGQDSTHTHVGLRHSPWKGAEFNTGLGQDVTENGPRVYASAGMVQNWDLNAHWTADAGLDRVETLTDPGTPAFDPQVPPSNGGYTEDYTATFLGAGYHDEHWRWRSRVEFRNAHSSDKFNLYSGLYRQLNGADTIGGALRHESSEENGETSVSSTLQFDFVHRPDNARWIVLDQAQLVMDRRDSIRDSLDGQRIVNNLNANWQYDSRNQLGIQYGAKYVFDTIDNVRYTGYTDVTGLEFRHDLSAAWDVGARTSLLHSWSAGNSDESLGVFVGWSPIPNLWLSIGYNVKGFRDDDFAGANYRAQGFNLDFRMKFDQHSIRQGWDGASQGSMHAPRPAE